jgi:replicative DNA helicase
MTSLSKLSTYGVGFQVKVLASLLKHKEFLQNIHDVLEPESFDNPAHKWIVEEIGRYYRTYNTTPSLDSLQVEVKKISNEVLKVSVIEQLKEAYKITNDDKEYVEQEFSTFCKNQQLKNALFSSVDLLQSGQYDSIRSIIDQALKAGQDKNIGHEYVKDIETRYRVEDRSSIPSDWEKINELLMGGLGAGDFGIIFGNPGGGKSWCLVSLGATAVKLGYNVLHYTLELSESYVGKRYDACFSGIPVDKLGEHRKEVEELIATLPGKLIVKEYSPGRASISTIESHVQKCKDLGIVPDIIIIDYVDLLKSKRKSAEKKEEIDDVYTAAKGLARELKVPVWTVSQVNRAGAKDNIIEGDKAAGSYDKMMIADFAMSLSRQRQDKVNGTGRFHIMKNRYGMDGMSYGATVDTSTGKIVIETSELGEDVVAQPMQLGSGSGFGVFNQSEKDLLSKKFYELGNIG